RVEEGRRDVLGLPRGPDLGAGRAGREQRRRPGDGRENVSPALHGRSLSAPARPPRGANVRSAQTKKTVARPYPKDARLPRRTGVWLSRWLKSTTGRAR